MGRNVGHFVIHGVTWDGCDQGIEIDSFVNVQITQCKFQHILPINSTLTLRVVAQNVSTIACFITLVTEIFTLMLIAMILQYSNFLLSL